MQSSVALQSRCSQHHDHASFLVLRSFEKPLRKEINQRAFESLKSDHQILLLFNLQSRLITQAHSNSDSSDTNMGTPLHEAVTTDGSVESIQSMLASGADVNAKDHKSETPLHLAVSNNKVAVVKLLLEHGASVGCENACQQTPLHRVRWATDEAAKIVQLLVLSGADVNAKDRTSETPLHLAASRDDVPIVRLLFQHGASVDSRDTMMRTPLHRALLSKTTSLETLELLLKHEADPNTKDYKDEPPLHTAVSRGDPTIVLALIKHGASVDCRDKCGRTPLHRSVIDEASAMVDLLLSNGADANAEDPKSLTPLHLAASHNNVAIVLKLLQSGASVDYTDERRRTPLHLAIEVAASGELVDLLLTSGAQPNAINSDGETPLHLALSHENASHVGLLLQHGASVDCQDDNRRTPLHRVRWAMDEAVKIFELLVSSGADVDAKDRASETPLHLAASRDDVPIVRLLLQHDASVDSRNGRMLTPLHRALLSEMASPRMFELLLTNGADPNVKDTEDETPLHTAVSRGDPSIVLALIKHGALVDRHDRSGRTPLHRSLIDEASAMVDALLANGADANAKDREGDRPLHYACGRWDYPDRVLRSLLGKGALVNARNYRDESALYLALRYRKMVAVKELLRHGADVEYPNVRELIGWVFDGFSCRSYLIAAKLADLPFGRYATDAYLLEDPKYPTDGRDRCLREIEELKKTFIRNRVSLYDFLHMRVWRRAAYTSSEELRRIVKWPSLKKQFLEYATIIQASYREAATRKSLLDAAEECLCAMTQTPLPDVIEHILDFLDDGDLIKVVDANDLGSTDDEEKKRVIEVVPNK